MENKEPLRWTLKRKSHPHEWLFLFRNFSNSCQIKPISLIHAYCLPAIPSPTTRCSTPHLTMTQLRSVTGMESVSPEETTPHFVHSQAHWGEMLLHSPLKRGVVGFHLRLLC